MRVGLVGDLEGEVDAAVGWLTYLGERGDVRTVYQLGDLRFGMGADPDGYLDAIEAVCAEHGLRLYGINGNHEHWERLDRLWADAGGLVPLRVSQHVTLLPRGHRWRLGGRTFVALGGAPSVNRHLLTEGVDWWPTEVIGDEDVDRVVAGGSADVMLTHDSPGPPWCTAPVAETITTNPWGWPEESLAYARRGVDLVTRAVLGVRPRLLAHGHFHLAGETDVRLPGGDVPTTIWSLAARQDPGTVRVLDLNTLASAPAATSGPAAAARRG